jgi:2-dehydro-3-deoxygalactonokinase
MTGGLFLALDWGNSNLRAAVVDAGGTAHASFSAADGCSGLGPGDFAARLAAVRAALGAEALPALACGAVGAREGWVEVPYVPLPARPIAVAAALGLLPDARIHIVPGLSVPVPPRAILRGEESQLLGLDLAQGRVCLPGTHSKWVTLEKGVIAGFESYQTGEMFGLVTHHTRIGAEGDVDDPAGFAFGLALADSRAPLTASLFAIRTDRILGALPDSQSTAAIAGLLIGAEVAHALARPTPGPLLLCGEPAMTRRYRIALARHGVEAVEEDGTRAAWRGLARIACDAGLIHG